MTRKEPGNDIQGIGPPPSHLSDELIAIWKELAASIVTTAVAPSDRASFELMTRLVDRMRRGDLAAAETAQLRGLLDAFGLSPSGRQRLRWAAHEPRIN